MRRTLRVLIAMSMVGWLLAGAVGGVAAQSQTQVTLTVSVVDQSDASIGGATVLVSWDGGERTATTASNGRAFVDVPEGEDVELDIDHEDYIRNHPLEVDDATEQDVTLDVSEKGRSTVRVTNGDDGALADARIEFQRDGRTAVSGQTSDNGGFSTGVIEQGQYEVSVVKPGYFRVVRTERVGRLTPKEFTLERGTVPLEVRVTDDHFTPSRPVEDVRVSVSADNFDASVRTSGGTASLSVPVNTRYNVTTSKGDYVSTSRLVSIDESGRQINTTVQRVATLTVEPQNNRVVVGETTRVRVLNAYGETVEGATVTKNGEEVGETDASGELVVTIESAGDQEFVATNGDIESSGQIIEGVESGPQMTATDEPTATATEGDGPGFGIAVAVMALLTLGVLFRRD
jgi:PGF-CTERM protein